MKPRNWPLILVIAMALSGAILRLSSCIALEGEPKAQSSQPPRVVDPNTVLKVRVTAAGVVTADDRTVTIEELTQRLEELKAKKGSVWFYREKPPAEAHPTVFIILELIESKNVSFEFAAKPDFSDVVEELGIVLREPDTAPSELDAQRTPSTR